MVKYMISRERNKHFAWIQAHKSMGYINLVRSLGKISTQSIISKQDNSSSDSRDKIKRFNISTIKNVAINGKYNQADTYHEVTGFTLVEVLIAGILLALVMAGVSRISLSAITNSMHQHERTSIEADINDNIQLLQHADSQLTNKKILANDERSSACEAPAEYLNSQIIESNGAYYVEPPSNVERRRSNHRSINRSTITNDPSGNLIIVYSFEGPGTAKASIIDSTKLIHATELSNATEQRVFELSPQFQAELCGLGSMIND